ncbi:hypothetical protein BJ138DRAFT_1103083 [Hygrophoropsis aurantiaca]|uniref:Uncharacterized protein n=1 Tax=Hygrophoropsis aurantiaca TaxID=72124 RepID=A0ACB8A8C4_9AGAM|nr:hypothetical protein BJ138DRAFT_1103083 [Hygrophoropsis aurantiaca]
MTAVVDRPSSFEFKEKTAGAKMIMATLRTTRARIINRVYCASRKRNTRRQFFTRTYKNCARVTTILTEFLIFDSHAQAAIFHQVNFKPFESIINAFSTVRTIVYVTRLKYQNSEGHLASTRGFMSFPHFSKTATESFRYILTTLTIFQGATGNPSFIAKAKSVRERLEPSISDHLRLPLHGLLISIKDFIPVKGRWLSAGFIGTLQVSEDDCDMTGILRQLGAVFYVKTNQPQGIMTMECQSFYARICFLWDIWNTANVIDHANAEAMSHHICTASEGGGISSANENQSDGELTGRFVIEHEKRFYHLAGEFAGIRVSRRTLPISQPSLERSR